MFQVETWWSVISLAYPLSSFSFYRYNNECSGVKKRGRCIAIYWWVCVLHNPADLTKSSNIKVHRSLWCTDLNLTASQSHEKPHLDWFKTAQHRIGEQFTVFYFIIYSYYWIQRWNTQTHQQQLINCKLRDGGEKRNLIISSSSSEQMWRSKLKHANLYIHRNM